MKEILIATRNEYKRQQFEYLLRYFGVKIWTLKDFNFSEKVNENGRTARENASLKAVFWTRKTGLPSIGDDAGLYIDALGGEPGLQARRWNGLFNDDVDDETWLNYLLERLKGVPLNKRTARWQAAWVLALPDSRQFIKDIVLEFLILEKPSRPYIPGSPMSAVRFFPKYGKVETELTKEEQWAELLEKIHRWEEFKKFLSE